VSAALAAQDAAHRQNAAAARHNDRLLRQYDMRFSGVNGWELVISDEA
jgi:hypothetical protein